MARVVMNHAAIQEYLDGKHGVAKKLRREGARVLGRAKSSAPFETGAYRSSLRMFETHTDRMAIRVGSDLDYAMAVEARTGTLSRALDG